MPVNINTSPPAGTRDFLPVDVVKREYLRKIITSVYESFGFVPIETPAIENIETLLGKYGEEGDQLLFKIILRRDKLTKALLNQPIKENDLVDLGLRYDLTVPLSRFFANQKNLPKFFKRYQIQPVWRADRPGKGRYREFLQCDIDIIGTSSIIAESEVCNAVTHVLLKLGIKDFSIHTNHRMLLKELISYAEINKDLENSALVALDKLDKIGPEGVLKELETRGISISSAQKLLNIVNLPNYGSNFSQIEHLKNLLSSSESANVYLKQISDFLDVSRNTSLADHIRIDFSLARGLGYYTGLIFEIRIPGVSGSLGGGGRYDGLIGMFKETSVPAVGFSLGFERLLMVLDERNLFPQITYGPDVLICILQDANLANVLEIAQKLRNFNIKVDIYPELHKIGKQISYAESINVNLVIILGANELQNNMLTIKNLKTTEQQTLPFNDAVQKIREWLNKQV